jgi:uncharacterized tellurite resistance protein B-like protein
MSLNDRIVPLCDLLLGAAYADEQFKSREREEVKDMLADLSGGPLTPELELQIAGFDPASFDVTKSAGAFSGDSEEDRKRVLVLVAAINEADDEIDLAEDEYLRKLAKALALPDSALTGMTVDVEVDELREELAKVRKVPPPTPKQKAASVDVDLD